MLGSQLSMLGSQLPTLGGHLSTLGIQLSTLGRNQLTSKICVLWGSLCERAIRMHPK